MLILEKNDISDLRLVWNINFLEFIVGCVFSIVVVSILPHADFERNDHQEDAPHFMS